MNVEKVTKHLFDDDQGDMQIDVYHVFPGVEVAFMSLHMADFDFSRFETSEERNYISIRYCQEGRIEQEVNQEFFYLMAGDCSISRQKEAKKTFQFPLKHYHGINIGIDLDVKDNPLVEYLEKCDCSMEAVMNHICGSKEHVVLRASEIIQKYFEEIYAADEEDRYDYLKVKLVELFYRMKHAQNHEEDEHLVPRTQVDFVKEVSAYISEHLNERITLKQLTHRFGVSDTYIQNAFRSVYGMPVISFIRVQKMHSAAQSLIHTTRTIEEIAEEFGYENESKFSLAFKKIMGDTPGVYRKEHSKVKII